MLTEILWCSISEARASRESSTESSISGRSSDRSPQRQSSSHRLTLRCSAHTVIFTATVLPSTVNANTPTGTVTLYNGTLVLGTVTLVQGSATFATASLPFGVIQITAVYSGDAIFATSTSTALQQTVKRLPRLPRRLPRRSFQPWPPHPLLLLVRPWPPYRPATVPNAGPVAVVKKAASPKKAHPKAGSTTKFHQTKHAATLKRSVELISKHAKVKVKKK